MCGIPLVQGCPQKKPPGRADSKPRHCVVFWDSDLVVVRHHHQSQRNRCAMKQVSTTKYLIIMQYPFMTVSWIMNASVYKLHFEVWLCTKQHGFGNGVNQDIPRSALVAWGSHHGNHPDIICVPKKTSFNQFIGADGDHLSAEVEAHPPTTMGFCRYEDTGYNGVYILFVYICVCVYLSI